MILRRLTQHVKDQNWFAVALDFLIVLAGIVIAFQITKWSEDRSGRAELVRAETALQIDLARNYFNAAERISLTDCRLAELGGLADRLLAPGETWEGMPRQESDIVLPRAINGVLRSPSRNWGSRVWTTGLAQGTFNHMEAERRTKLDLLFEQAEKAQTLQKEIHALQARLKILSRTTELSRTDRLRYFDIISEVDEHSGILELIAGQILDTMELIDVRLDAAQKSEFRSFLAERNTARKAVYGACAKSTRLPFLEETETETAP